MSNPVLVVDNLGRFLYLLCRVMNPSLVYYFRRARTLDRIGLPPLFVHLTTDVCPDSFRETLLESFAYTNSTQLKFLDDYRRCRQALSGLLPGAHKSELDVAVKRLFHRSVYDRIRKKKLVEHIRRKHPAATVSTIGVSGNFGPGDNFFRNSLPLRAILSLYSLFRELFIKLAALGYLLRRLTLLRFQRTKTIRETDVLFVVHDQHHMIEEIARELARRSISFGFLKIGRRGPREWEQLAGQDQCFRLGHVASTPRFFARFVRSVMRFYLASLGISSLDVYKRICVFFSKLQMYMCAFESIKAAVLITNEDYQEFNPRHFAARERGCQILNILTSAVVPPYNPYFAYCLIDAEASFSRVNVDVLRASGCRIGTYIPMTHFGGFLSYMRPRYWKDRTAIDNLLGERRICTRKATILSYYSTGNKNNFSYIDMPIEVKLRVLGYLKEYMEANNNTILIVKLHPAESDKEQFMREYQGLVGLRNVFFVDSSVSSYSLLEYSDVNISDLSTMGLHSAFFGFKTIVVDALGVGLDFKDGTSGDRFRCVKDKEGLFAAIEELSSISRQQAKTNKSSLKDRPFFDDAVQYVIHAKLQKELSQARVARCPAGAEGLS